MVACVEMIIFLGILSMAYLPNPSKAEIIMAKSGSTDKSQDDFEENVTILIYLRSQTGFCVLNQVETIRKRFPEIRIIVYPAMDLNMLAYGYYRVMIKSGLTSAKEGEALDWMLKLVKTDYVLYLPRGVMLDLGDFDSPSSAKWLYKTLRAAPNVDVIGGVITWPNEAKSVNYCGSENAEKTKSLKQKLEQMSTGVKTDSLKVCSATSVAFMAKTSSLKSKFGSFSRGTSGVVADFFRRAKSGLIAQLSDVVFKVSEQCLKNNIGDKAA